MAQTSSFLPSSTEYKQDARAPQKSNDQRRCIYCGHLAPLVWVHGHGQCTSCGINVEECCRGESCD